MHSHSLPEGQNIYSLLGQQRYPCLSRYDVIFTPLIAKILSQVENASETVPVEIIARPKGKDVSSDAFPRFLALYTSAKTVGILPKENPSGKFVSEWKALVAEAATKPELVDVTPAYSSFMSIKDKEELVRNPR